MRKIIFVFAFFFASCASNRAVVWDDAALSTELKQQLAAATERIAELERRQQAALESVERADERFRELGEIAFEEGRTLSRIIERQRRVEELVGELLSDYRRIKGELAGSDGNGSATGGAATGGGRVERGVAERESEP